MARTNRKPQPAARTHEGGPAIKEKPLAQLRRTLMTCLLWEDGFYEDGQTVADRIKSLIPLCKPVEVRDLAIEARREFKLRHVPLLIAREMARLEPHKQCVSYLLNEIIERPDELTEFVSIYWKDGRQPLSAQVKKGLAKAFTKFSAYQLAKYNRDNAVTLRDVLFLCHAKATSLEQQADWNKLIEGKLESPDTWEVQLSAGKDKKATFERLIAENKLGAMALLRNLRNMREANVHPDTVRGALRSMKTERVLPFRFISAAKYAPDMEPELEAAMFKCLEGVDRLPGRTAVLVDISGSMFGCKVSAKSELERADAACALAILVRELGETDVFSFSNETKRVPARRGFGLRDAILNSQSHGGTELGKAIRSIKPGVYDRLIVITDEQSHDSVGAPTAKRGYMVNVASNQNGVGYGDWTRITGWSESIVKFIHESESSTAK